jgi:hypothetical protein
MILSYKPDNQTILSYKPDNQTLLSCKTDVSKVFELKLWNYQRFWCVEKFVTQSKFLKSFLIEKILKLYVFLIKTGPLKCMRLKIKA